MTKQEKHKLLNKIIKGMKAAVAEVYADARKNGTELVIATKSGKIKKIKVH
ncbi:MAG: hypothetical protein IPP32_10085 [Bacteroidetes bacterium]|nr:hypothetical protein [Bacteroidota bacterium]